MQIDVQRKVSAGKPPDQLAKWLWFLSGTLFGVFYSIMVFIIF